MARSVQIVFDCADPAALAAFWAAALGYEMQPPPDGFASWEDWLRERGVPESEWNSRNAVVDPDGVGPRLFFQRVPEPKTGKVCIHLDVNVGGGPGTPFEERRRRIDAAVDRLVGLGAERIGAFEQMGEYWVGMRDPEGHEFDVQ
jgi:hypothetical protein